MMGRVWKHSPQTRQRASLGLRKVHSDLAQGSLNLNPTRPIAFPNFERLKSSLCELHDKILFFPLTKAKHAEKTGQKIQTQQEEMAFILKCLNYQ